MSFYPRGGYGPSRHRRRGNRGCGCLMGLVAAVMALLVLGLILAALLFADRPGGDVGDPVTPAPSSAGSGWQPSGG